MIKEMINELNNAMYDGNITFDVVNNLCKQLSKLTGKEYCIITLLGLYATGLFAVKERKYFYERIRKVLHLKIGRV